MTATLWTVGTFASIALLSCVVGFILKRFKLPAITGYLLMGIIAGPYVLAWMSGAELGSLRIIDELSLAVIAFAAGNELRMASLRPKARSITMSMGAQVLIVFGLGTLAVYALLGWIPVLSSLHGGARWAVALLVGAMLLARSPSSAIAIVKETRAKGPMTQGILGVTMLTDFVVIVLFAVSFSFAKTLIDGGHFGVASFVGLGVELLIALVGSLLLKWLIEKILSLGWFHWLEMAAIAGLGYVGFLACHTIYNHSHELISMHLHPEPLLVCMLAGFWLGNYSKKSKLFSKRIHDMTPVFLVAFFTYTGASLQLGLLAGIWPFALAIVVLRMLTLATGSWLGGTMAGDPALHNRISWMAYLTQAGVGLGLAKEVAHAFPTWGEHFAMLMISVIIINQLIGPPFFKWVLHKAKEDESSRKAAKAAKASTEEVSAAASDSAGSSPSKILRPLGSAG